MLIVIKIVNSSAMHLYSEITQSVTVETISSLAPHFETNLTYAYSGIFLLFIRRRG
jgi:hypothetical protein